MGRKKFSLSGLQKAYLEARLFLGDALISAGRLSWVPVLALVVACEPPVSITAPTPPAGAQIAEKSGARAQRSKRSFKKRSNSKYLNKTRFDQLSVLKGRKAPAQILQSWILHYVQPVAEPILDYHFGISFYNEFQTGSYSASVFVRKIDARECMVIIPVQAYFREKSKINLVQTSEIMSSGTCRNFVIPSAYEAATELLGIVSLRDPQSNPIRYKLNSNGPFELEWIANQRKLTWSKVVENSEETEASMRFSLRSRTTIERTTDEHLSEHIESTQDHTSWYEIKDPSESTLIMVRGNYITDDEGDPAFIFKATDEDNIEGRINVGFETFLPEWKGVKIDPTQVVLGKDVASYRIPETDARGKIQWSKPRPYVGEHLAVIQVNVDDPEESFVIGLDVVPESDVAPEFDAIADLDALLLEKSRPVSTAESVDSLSEAPFDAIADLESLEEKLKADSASKVNPAPQPEVLVHLKRAEENQPSTQALIEFEKIRQARARDEELQVNGDHGRAAKQAYLQKRKPPTRKKAAAAPLQKLE